MSSVWTEGSLERKPAAPLVGERTADVVIVGGGMTGLMTALATHEAGLRTVVLEADAVGRSNTGGSTGNLYATLSQGLAPTRKKWGVDVVRRVAQLRADAVLRIEALAQRLDIAGQFGRVPLLLAIGSDESKLQELDDEFLALQEAGLAPVRTDAFPNPVRAAIAIENQAQFNPLRFVQALAAHLEAAGVAIHEGTRALDADAGDGCVRTAQGVVRAKHIVYATHTPKGFNLV
jgi:glycine/D-amino acid oxidase-like deaminating enzyme